MSACKYTAATLQFFKFTSNRTDFLRFTKHAKVISASKGKVQVELEILPEMVEDSGDMASGCLFTVFDNITTSAAFNKYQGIPATVAAQVHYFIPARLGDILRIDAEIIHKRDYQNQIYVEAEFHSIERDRLVAKGGQTMAFPGGQGMHIEDLPKPEM